MLQNNQTKVEDSQCGFCPGFSTTDQIILSKKFLRYLADDVYTCFVDLKKVYTWVPLEKLWECYRSMVLMVKCH